jgi:hypothetical protein
MGVNLQAHRRADFRQATKDVQWNKHLIADAADIEHDLPGVFLREPSADLRYHNWFEGNRAALPPRSA